MHPNVLTSSVLQGALFPGLRREPDQRATQEEAGQQDSDPGSQGWADLVGLSLTWVTLNL